MKKTILPVMVFAVLVLPLAACDKSDTKSSPASVDSTSTNASYVIPSIASGSKEVIEMDKKRECYYIGMDETNYFSKGKNPVQGLQMSDGAKNNLATLNSLPADADSIKKALSPVLKDWVDGDEGTPENDDPSTLIPSKEHLEHLKVAKDFCGNYWAKKSW